MSSEHTLSFPLHTDLSLRSRTFYLKINVDYISEMPLKRGNVKDCVYKVRLVHIPNFNFTLSFKP